MIRRCVSLLLFIALSGCATFDLYSEEGKRRLEHVSLRIDTFEIEIQSRGEAVWHGVAKINRMKSALYSVDATEASGPRCLPIGSGQPNSYTVEFRANKYGGNARDPDSYHFQASIRRSDLAADCKETIITSAIAEKDSVRLRRGQKIKISGDDGFIVMIYRR